MFFKNSKPFVGFDDRLLLIAGVVVNTHLAVTIFYQGAIYKVPFQDYFPKWLEYFCFIGLMWLILRGFFLFNRSKLPGPKNRTKRWLLVPTLLPPFILLATIHMKYVQPLLNNEIPGYSIPVLKDITVIGVFIILVDVSIYTILIYIYELNKVQVQKERLKKENALNQLKALKNQISPHFLSNSLTTLLYLIETNKEKSIDFVHKLALLYNKLLEFSEQNLIPIKEEIEYINAYADLLQSRFGKNLKISIECPNGINNKKIVPLSTQVGIENAVKHNIVSSLKPLKVKIKVNEQHVVIENNYQPREKASEPRQGIGIKNINKRYQLLTEMKIQVEKSDSMFVVKIPIIED